MYLFPCAKVYNKLIQINSSCSNTTLHTFYFRPQLLLSRSHKQTSEHAQNDVYYARRPKNSNIQNFKSAGISVSWLLDEEEMEAELSLLKATVSELAESPVLKEFSSVWQEMGLTEDVRKTRRETIQAHLTNLLKEIVDEEINLKQKLVDSVGVNERELESLARTLSLGVELVSMDIYICVCVNF